MSELVNAELVSWLFAKETTAGTLAAASWKEAQVEPGGITLKRDLSLLQRNPLSKRRQIEEGQIVGQAASPSFNHDWNYDMVDAWADPMFLATAAHNGNTGLALFKPTAVTATGYTVAALGALTNNFMVRVLGWQNSANNGVKVLAGTSTGTEIKTTGLVAEAAISGRVPLLEVCGWQGASGDIGMDASGNLTSTASVFTSWNLTVGQWIYVGGELGTAATNFANTLYRGYAKVKTIAAGLLTLERRTWTVGAADAGAAKTIQVYFGRHWRNVAHDHASSLTAASVQPSYSHEIQLPGAAAAAATSYVYGTGCMLANTTISAPEMTKVGASFNFVGRDVTAPTTVRATGASTAEIPIKTALFNTAHHVVRIKVAQKSNDASLLVDISNWTLSLTNNISPQTQQGVLGARRMVVGECGVSFDVGGYLVQDDTMTAAADARLVTFDVAIRNADGTVLFDVPNGQLTAPDLDFPENGPVTLSTSVMASRDAAFYDTTLGMSTFPYTPAS